MEESDLVGEHFYKIIVKGKDPLGINFLQNVIEMANKGAVIDPSHTVRMSFPHQCVMTLKSKEVVESDVLKGIEVCPVQIAYSRKELEEMDFDELRKICKKNFNISGKERKVMIDKYLSAVQENM